MRGSRTSVGFMLLFLPFFGSISATSHTLIGPQIFREGVEETLMLNLHRVTGVVDVTVSLSVLGGVKNFQFPGQDAGQPISLPVKYTRPQGQPESNKRVYVEAIVDVKKGNAKIHSVTLKMRMVDERGYLYVQTDRPIYKPEETVNVRVAALNHHQKPELERRVEIVIRIPLDKVAVEKKTLIMPPEQFITTSFKLPEYPVFGVWTIEARYVDEKYTKWSTTTFQVQPYVLPTFEVKLHMSKPYVLLKDDMFDEHIQGLITSQYSYGKPVGGSYFLVAKLHRPDRAPDIFYQFPSDMSKKGNIVSGIKNFKIKVSEITKVLAIGETYSTLLDEGAAVTFEASVTGKEEGVVEMAASSKLPFVKSPYKIDVSRMSKYFIPGTTFEIKVDIKDTVSNQPVKDLAVVVTDKNGIEVIKEDTDGNGQVNAKINMNADVAEKTYHITTRDFEIPDENAPKMEVKLSPYKSASKSILQLSAPQKIATVGDNNFEIDVWFNKKPTDLRYLIFARGLIVGSGKHVPEKGSVQTNFKISIIGEMVPSFRIFVFYINGAEIVSNSLWIDVKDQCKKEVTVTVPEMVIPGQDVMIQYEGSPNAVLGLSAVDRASYFMHGEGRLKRGDFFDSLNHYEGGCVREGGKNAQHVFEEGGLQLVGGPYPTKDDFNKCPEEKGRRRRSAKDNNEENLKAKLEELKEESENRNCKFDAYVENLAEVNCTVRAEWVQKAAEEKGHPTPYKCARLFYDTCRKLNRMRKISRTTAKSAGDNAGGYKKLFSSARTDFEESMLWMTMMLDANGKLQVPAKAKDSITTFEFDTVSMHNHDGFCVAETKNMKIFKDVFIQLRLPYSLKRREQVELSATVFNYASSDKQITVSVKVGKDLCSHFTHEKFTKIQTLYVANNSAETTSFVVMPLKVPDDEYVHIEVQAREGNDLLDWIKKKILVEPEGIVKEIKGTRAIDLKTTNKNQFKIDLRFPENFVLGTRQCWLYPYSNFMGPIIEFDPVTKQPKNDVKNIIRMPGGCGEQTMLSMGPNTYAHKYLKSVGRMEDGSAEEAGSIAKLKAGFANELKYRNAAENVWSVFPRHQPSVWLNAYVNKVFAQAKQFYTDMDVTPICNSVKWLLKKQEADGGFATGGRVIHKEMHGAVGTKLSLSAYVLISLVESSSLCPDISTEVAITIQKAITYLVNNENSPEMNQPYTLSLVTYAMVLAAPEHDYTQRLITKLKSVVQYSDDNRYAFWKGAPLAQIQGTKTHAYWYQRKPLAIDIEATGYSLLALIFIQVPGGVTQEILDLTRKITLWLIEQRDENGGFTTTQDTVVGLQALSAYMVWSNAVEPPSKKVDIFLTISGADGTEWSNPPHRIHLDKTNENSTTPIPVPPRVIAKGLLDVSAEGEGDGSLSYRCVYRTIVEEDSCHFEISVTTAVKPALVRAAPGQEKPLTLKLSLFIRKPVGAPSGQSIVEVNLISGFKAVESTLEQLSKTFYLDGTIERYELSNQKVILYLDEITEEPIRMAFLIVRSVPVAVPEPSSVSVYDYYEPSIKCTQFYGLPGDIPQLRTSCKREDGAGGGDICQCAEGGCLKCRTREEQLDKTACLPELGEKCDICTGDNCFDMAKLACQSNYVYEVVITKGKTEKGIFVDFEAQIFTVFKKGNDVLAERNVNRTFRVRSDCFSSCRDPALEEGKKDEEKLHFIHEGRRMLIMGNIDAEDVRLKNGEITEPKYDVNYGTYIERIIPTEKCRKARTKAEGKCKDSNTEDCMKQKKMHQSCNNLRQMRRMLIKGCDNSK